jgi:hypothetical protein
MDQQPIIVPRSGRLMDVFDVLKVFLKIGSDVIWRADRSSRLFPS